MARKIKRFLVFMFFSLFFAMFSKKIQTQDSSPKAKQSVAQRLNPIGVNSAVAASCSCEDGEWYCN